jgi:plastocyanin
MKYTLTALSIFLFTSLFTQTVYQPNCFGEFGYIYNNNWGNPNSCYIISLYDENGNEVPLIQTGSNSYRYDVYPGIYIPIYSPVCPNTVFEHDILIIHEPFRLIETYPAFDCSSNTSTIDIYNNEYTLTVTDSNGNTIDYQYESMMDGVYRITVEPGIYTISGYREGCNVQPESFTVNTNYVGSVNVSLLSAESGGDLVDNGTLNISVGTTIDFEGLVTDYYGSQVGFPNDSISFSWETTGGIETPNNLAFSHTFSNSGVYTVSLVVDDGVCVKTDNIEIIVSDVISVDEVNSGVAFLQVGNQIRVVMEGEFQYLLYAIDGRVIASGKSFGSTYIDTYGLSVGAYLLSVLDSDSVISKRFSIR